MASIADENAALDALKSFLIEVFASDEAATFEPFGGVDVVKANEERATEQVGRPCLVLSVRSDQSSRWAGANGGLRDCVVKATVKANDFSGALIGVENMQGADTLLRSATRRAIQNNRDVLDALGLELSACTSGEGKFEGEHEVPLEITFSYSL